MKQLALVLTLLALVWSGCRTQDRPHDETDGDGDGDTDVDGDTDSDADLQCGDEREPLDLGPEPIVNGSDRWDDSVVSLSDGQALAVGALMSNAGGGSWSNACTATLVSRDMVLTAAHCVTDFWTGRTNTPSQVRFAIGPDAASPVHTFMVQNVYRHPSYNPRNGGNAQNDLALLELTEDATSAVPELIPIAANCSTVTSDQFVGQRVQNVGYGLTQPWEGWTPPPDNSRRYWTVEEVVELTSYDFIVDGHGISAVCNGDSGGPSLWTMADGVIRVMGTVSWGDPSCVDRDHFARVDAHCDFISEHVDPGDPCGGETAEGRCDGEVAIWCDGGAIQTQDCGLEGLSCTVADGRAHCADVDTTCGGLGWEGRCEGDNAVWCDEDGQLRTRRCADCGQICGWSDVEGGFYCL